MRIELTLDADTLQVSAYSSRGEWAQHRSNVTLQDLEQFTRRVRQAAERCERLDADALKQATALHRAVFHGEVAEMTAGLREAAPAKRLLQRLMIRGGPLQAVPWEALRGPDGSEDFWGVRQKTLVARGVISSEPCEPREIGGAVKLLTIAPASEEHALHNLKRALKDSLEAGQIEWLEPIVGARAGKRYLLDQLGRSKGPHIVHFRGHGGVRDGKPVLLLGHGYQDDDDAWITFETLARELHNFHQNLRLVVLEACEGARQGTFGSAAEILAREAADAVVAHMWPVRAEVARACSGRFYEVLAGALRPEQGGGNVVASLAAARSSLLSDSAEAFSPVLYLRGSDATIFDFPRSRKGVIRPMPAQAVTGRAADLAPALRALLQKPFSLVLGNNDHRAEDTAALRSQVERFLSKQGDDRDFQGVPLGVLAQRCVLVHGQESLSKLFQQALVALLNKPGPGLVTALARVLRPGVHVTLFWRPLLERAVAEAQPMRTIHVIQPPLLGGAGPLDALVRVAGAEGWRGEPHAPGQLDFKSDIIILRLYGGYLPVADPIFTSPMVAEDDHIRGLIGVEGLRPPAWTNEFMHGLRMHPALFAGLSVLEWQHRMLLRWLFNNSPVPPDSVVVLDPAVDQVEQAIWRSGGSLPGHTHIATICQDADALAGALNAFAPEAQS